jgi:hypothetical protein
MGGASVHGAVIFALCQMITMHAVTAAQHKDAEDAARSRDWHPCVTRGSPACARGCQALPYSCAATFILTRRQR